MNEHLMPSVNVLVETFDVETGELLHSQEVHNLVVTAGLNLLRDAINTGTCAFVTHFALGTGTTAVQPSDTTLGTEVVREALADKNDDEDAQLVCQYYLASGVGNGNTLAEAGLFTAASGGTMYARVVLADPIIKTAAVATSFTWTLSWGAA